MTTSEHGFLTLVGAQAPDAKDGTARLEVDVDERHLNAAGAVHGGMLATLVDTTMGAAVRSTVDTEAAATSQLTVTYLRPGKPGRLSVVAKVSKRGESLTICEADVTQDLDRLVLATSPCTTAEDLRRIATTLNRRPRPTLDRQTPA